MYFTSNQESNKLYLNQGNLEFKDITIKAKVSDEIGWTTGVAIIDINNDGWLDIYVCKSGSLKSHQNRKNKLFINQKNNTFKESAAKYGLDHFGFSLIALILVLPFMQPFPVGPLSVIGGLTIAALGIQLFKRKPFPVLPKRLLIITPSNKSWKWITKVCIFIIFWFTCNWFYITSCFIITTI